MRLKDKIILVTGGDGLIGNAIVTQARAEGAICISCDIKVMDRSDHNLEMDITDANSIERVLEQVYGRFGRLDGVINTTYPRTADWGTNFESIPLESWNRNIDLQLNSVFLLSRAVLEKMKSAGVGSLVNLASIYGIVGPDFSVYAGTTMTMPAAYSAIKGGIINFTRYLASYYGPYNIRINCISPGGIFDGQQPGFVKKYEDKVPLKRMAVPEDIAGPACFLLSDESAYITGHNLVVDGGWTAI